MSKNQPSQSNQGTRVNNEERGLPRTTTQIKMPTVKPPKK